MRHIEITIFLPELLLSLFHECHIKALSDTRMLMVEPGALGICSQWEFRTGAGVGRRMTVYLPDLLM